MASAASGKDLEGVEVGEDAEVAEYGSWLTRQPPWPDRWLVPLQYSSLVMGGVIGWFVGRPSSWSSSLESSSWGALVLLLVAVWVALDRWKEHFVDLESVSLKFLTEAAGLALPMVVVGAATVVFIKSSSQNGDFKPVAASGALAGLVLVVCFAA